MVENHEPWAASNRHPRQPAPLQAHLQPHLAWNLYSWSGTPMSQRMIRLS